MMFFLLFCQLGFSAESKPVNPVRKVVVRSVGTKIFNLPNGSAIDLSTDLDTMLSTVLTNHSRLSPSTGSPDAPCDSHIEVRAAITTLELDLTDIGIKIGFNPKGAIPIGNMVGGEVKVRRGTIAMDFSVWQCERGECYAVVASTASHATTGTELNFGINLGVITIGPHLVHNTALGGILRKIIEKGVAEMAASSRIAELAWQANVVSVNASDSSAILDVGARERIEPNQELVVYAPVVASSSCRVYQAVAYIRTVQVDTVSSVARMEIALSQRGIEVGDVVMVKPMNR